MNTKSGAAAGPQGRPFTTVGMLHVPINTILASPPSHREALALPVPTPGDWALARELARAGLTDYPGLILTDEDLRVGRERVRALSFYRFLEDRALSEAAVYTRHGFAVCMLENIAGPYFVRGRQPPVLYWVMRVLAERVKEEYPGGRLGLQVLAFSDDWAMDIACACSLDFIRCESALFEGLRPEGRTPNRGNLAGLYMARQELLAGRVLDGRVPRVHVDLQKKHTLFSGELDSLEPWVDNILFQKIEGVIITGKATGSEVAEADLRRTRAALDEIARHTRSALGRAWAPPLWVGSGVNEANLGLCRMYADGAIVGSALKRNGYWECPLDEERVRRFSGVLQENAAEGARGVQ